MHPADIAHSDPHRPAIIVVGDNESRQITTYAELVESSDRVAHFFRQQGLQAGDTIALCLENCAEFFVTCWASFNLGLYFVPISTRLKADEIQYILKDCGAKLFVTSAAIPEAQSLPRKLATLKHWLMLENNSPDFTDFSKALDEQGNTKDYSDVQGAPMLYTSGTTGFPKGVKPKNTDRSPYEPPPLLALLGELYGFDEDTVYLSTGPLYHATPLKFNMAVHTLGGTSVILSRFDALTALKAMEAYSVTHSQWVPTMLSRLLKLPKLQRETFNLSTHKVAIHGAAPCPVELKQEMFNWWGPILYEYYGGSESVGLCAIDPKEWQENAGSVGRPVRGVVHILDDDGNSLPPGEIGHIFFANGGDFTYHNDPEKTARAFNEQGWATLGDLGYLNDKGYLFLTDRQHYVINVGGVNVYPQEAENCLSMHPAVADAAVFGIPHSDLGEEVKAVIQLNTDHDASSEMASNLIDFCQQRLAKIKCPRSIDFIQQLPREPSGKLLKRKLINQYRAMDS